MRVLVTGATGFLGGAVARRLRAQGHDVVATGRDVSRRRALEADGITFVRADLTQRLLVEQLCRERDWVVHCAALSAPWGPRRAFELANVLATKHVVDGCVAARVKRLVHISTPSIYMGQGSRFRVAEHEPLPKPINHYARTKLRAEELVATGQARGLETVVLRPRALFGPGDQTIFPRLLRALSERRLPIIGDGQNVVDLTYIDNVVDAVLLACEANAEALGQPFNITNDEPVKLWDVIFELARALDLPLPTRRVSRATAMALATCAEAMAALAPGKKEPVLTRYGVSVLADSLTLDVERARKVLGYRPRVSVEEGLQRFVTSIKGKV